MCPKLCSTYSNTIHPTPFPPFQAYAESLYSGAVSRAKTHSEAITALGGAEREEAILQKQFSYVEGATQALHRAQSKFGLTFKLAYTYGCRSWMQVRFNLHLKKKKHIQTLLVQL